MEENFRENLIYRTLYSLEYLQNVQFFLQNYQKQHHKFQTKTINIIFNKKI